MRVFHWLAACVIAAIVYYALRKRQNLTRVMITGDQVVQGRMSPASRDSTATRLLAAMLIAACAVGVSWLFSLGE